jgi:hypothetical protein
MQIEEKHIQIPSFSIAAGLAAGRALKRGRRTVLCVVQIAKRQLFKHYCQHREMKRPFCKGQELSALS